VTTISEKLATLNRLNEKALNLLSELDPTANRQELNGLRAVIEHQRQEIRELLSEPDGGSKS